MDDNKDLQLESIRRFRESLLRRWQELQKKEPKDMDEFRDILAEELVIEIDLMTCRQLESELM